MGALSAARVQPIAQSASLRAVRARSSAAAAAVTFISRRIVREQPPLCLSSDLHRPCAPARVLVCVYFRFAWKNLRESAYIPRTTAAAAAARARGEIDEERRFESVFIFRGWKI